VRVGGGASFWSGGGDDLAGERIEQLLSEAGVETSGYRKFPGTTPTCEVFIEPGGERYLFPYLGDGMPAGADWIPHSAIDLADAVLIDGRWPEGGMRVVTCARERGIPCVHDLDQDRPEIWEIAKVASHVIADEDLALKCGGVEAMLRRIEGFGAWAAVTLGERGVAHSGGRVPPVPVTVTDSTGAGDVFHGAFALAMAQGRSEHYAMRFGCIAGALLCKLGRVPYLSEVAELLDGDSP